MDLITRYFDSKGYSAFTVAKFGVCYNFGKVNSSTRETTRISGVTDKYRGNNTVSLKRERDSYNSTMSEVHSQPTTSVLSLTKLIDLLSSTTKAILQEKIQFCFLQQKQISSPKRQESNQGVCCPWELTQKRTSLVDRKYKAIQRQKKPTARTSDDYPHRCFNNIVGRTLPWDLERKND